MQTSANQAGLQALMQQVPAWLMVPVLVVVGPFVEEYIFRHLLIGKLSRRLNIWLCCALSVVLFAALHIVGQEAITLPALLPYLAMGATLVFVYVWTGKNLMFSYFVHAAKNLLAVVFIYAIPPELRAAPAGPGPVTQSSTAALPRSCCRAPTLPPRAAAS